MGLPDEAEKDSPTAYDCAATYRLGTETTRRLRQDAEWFDRWWAQKRAGPMLNKWPHYFPAYHKHLARFRDRPVTVLEVGVGFGGGLEMWAEYFGKKAQIHGLDYNSQAPRLLEASLYTAINIYNHNYIYTTAWRHGCSRQASGCMGWMP